MTGSRILPYRQKKREEAEAFDRHLKQLLAGKFLSAKQIKEALGLDTDSRHLSRLLSEKEFLVTRKIKNTNHFSLAHQEAQQEKLL